MAAHPLLLDTPVVQATSKKDKYKPMLPKFASISANARIAPTPAPGNVHAPCWNPVLYADSACCDPAAPVAEVKSNPYASGGPAGGDAPKERAGRQFRFNQPGKYESLGNQLRQEVGSFIHRLSGLSYERVSRQNSKNSRLALLKMRKRLVWIANSKFWRRTCE